MHIFSLIRIYLKNKDIQEIYYEDKPVWVQELKNNVATIGFLDGSCERDVYIEELYEEEPSFTQKRKQF